MASFLTPPLTRCKHGGVKQAGIAKTNHKMIWKDIKFITISSLGTQYGINHFMVWTTSSGTIIHLDINVVLVPDEGASLSCSHTIIIKIKQLNEAAEKPWKT